VTTSAVRAVASQPGDDPPDDADQGQRAHDDGQHNPLHGGWFAVDVDVGVTGQEKDRQRAERQRGESG
jgi:hypothetical protein